MNQKTAKSKLTKLVAIYIITVLLLIITEVIVTKIAGKASMTVFLIINLVVPSLIIILSNFLINFDDKSSIKRCLLHALLLTLISFVIGLAAGKIMGNNYVTMLDDQDSLQAQEQGPDQEIYDELDKMAKEYAISQGLISEDDELYSMDGDNLIMDGANQELTGEWDVEIQEESPLSMVTGALCDFVLAFIGGLAGYKIMSKKRGEAKNEM